MWDHSSDCLVENARGSAEMEWTASCGIEPGNFAKISLILNCEDECVSMSFVVAKNRNKLPRFKRPAVYSMERRSPTFCAKELPRDVNGFATEDDDLLPVQ